jgi:regulator of RNase E activity RraB
MKIGENRFIQALERKKDHRDLIERMVNATSDNDLLYLAKKIVSREEVQREMVQDIIEELYGQHADNDSKRSAGAS